MLKYEVNIKDAVEEQTTINVTSYLVADVNYDGDDKIIVYCYSDALDTKCNVGENITVTITRDIDNDSDNDEPIIDTQILETTINTSNKETGEFTLFAPRYRYINITSIDEVEDENGIILWKLYFNDGHFFNSDEKISLDLIYRESTDEILHLDSIEYVDCRTLMWEVDDTIRNYSTLNDIIFYGFNLLSETIKVKRTQTLFGYAYHRDLSIKPDFTVVRPRVHLNIPISEKFDTSILKQDSIDHEFVDHEIDKSIPNFIEMEKNVYTPVVMLNEDNKEYKRITKINFNLHFREHSGENWTVQESDDWNFSKFGYTTINDTYYSYPSVDESNQSDLLGYLGFTNSDVRNQKNKLQKSFLRLSFYDSSNPTNQQLLAYSTIFFNTNKLYAKYMKGQMLNGWYLNEMDSHNKFDKISTKFELGVKSPDSKVPVSIRSDSEKIEDFRLSSQLSVQDKYSSHISSEGFYLYLWTNDKTLLPEHLYMKAEFNHAGYGRTIPMMAPYYIDGVDQIPTDINSKSKFKDNKQIKQDWLHSGYGIMRYNAYSYIKMKYMYDNDTKQYIYYLDPDIYGTLDGPILNINLYEARITF